jgi:hypothetical protein
MEGIPQNAERKKTKSDIIAQSTVQEFLQAHSKSNGHGWKSFIHSNLFAALLIWGLSQAVLSAAFIITFYLKTTQLTEWKGQTDATLKRMDAQGTINSHYANEQQDKQLSAIEVRLKRTEDDTRHIEVIESEHRRLTKDVEELRNGKK